MQSFLVHRRARRSATAALGSMVLVASVVAVSAAGLQSSAQAGGNGPRKVGKATIIDFAGRNGNTAYAGPNCVAAKAKVLDGLDWCFGGAYMGGTGNNGTLWMARPDLSSFRVIGNFDLTNGLNPSQYPVINAKRTALFGTTSNAGSSGIGSIYKYDLTKPASSNPLTTIASFSPATGTTPQAPPILIGNVLFGTTGQNGAHSGGTVWSFDTATQGAKITVLHSFAVGATDVSIPFGGLTYNPRDGLLYGMAFNGAANGAGGIFSLKKDGSNYALRASFNATTGGRPQLGSLLLSKDGNLYANTWNGAANNGGAIVRFNPTTSAMDVVFPYTTSTGLSPYSSLAESRSGKFLYSVTWRGNATKGGNGAIVAVNKATGTATNLFVFDGAKTGGQTGAGATVSPDGTRILTAMTSGGKYGIGTIVSIPVPKRFR